MNQKQQKLRTAILALSASIVLPTAPVFGQDAPVITPPPVVAPPPVAAPAPTPPAAATPAPAPRAQTPARTTARAPAPARATRAAPARQAAPVRAAPAPSPVQAPAPAPVAEPAASAAPTPLPVETPSAPVADEGRAGAGEMASGSALPWILGGLGLLLVAFAFFALRRRGRDEAYEEEVYYEEPAVIEAAPEPGFVRPEPVERAAPVQPAFMSAAIAAAATEPVRESEEPEVVEAADADVEALAASSAPVGNRPWIEFLMRPVRAGTSKDDAIVQFELTVGNTGDLEAKDVRISTWMVAAGSGSEHERSLIEAPSDAQVSEVDIAAGDGARVEGELAIAKGGESEPVLPVVVADARYRLPDGREGRTHAAFAIGLPDGEEDALTPFPTDRASGLRENVEARLHGEPERV